MCMIVLLAAQCPLSATDGPSRIPLQGGASSGGRVIATLVHQRLRPMSSTATEASAPSVKSIRDLASERSGATSLAAFTAHAREVAQSSQSSLLAEFDLQEDPLMLWVLHREADARKLPPCLRWGAVTRRSMASLPDDALSSLSAPELQRLFVNWLADIMWLSVHDRAPRPAESRWVGLNDSAPNSADWHGHAVRVFMEGACRPDSFASRLGLEKRSRSLTLTLTTHEADRDRSRLTSLDDLQARLEDYALRHPDRSGAFTPAQIVERRLLAHRVFLLAGRQHGLAAQYLSLVTGQPVSRQAFTRQIDAIAAAGVELRKPIPGSTDVAASLPVQGGAIDV